MKRIKSIRVKPWLSFLLKTIGIIICILLGIFIFYRKQIDDLKKIGYSEFASKNILFSKNKDYVMSIGKNKTLNLAFESEDYNPKNLNNYPKIKYLEQKDFIKNINKLLKVGYSNSDINIIFKHGDSRAVSRFAERDKVNYLEEFFSIDFAKLDNYDRYVQYSNETGEAELDVVIYVNLNLDKEDYVDSYEVNDFSTDMVINKHRSLSSEFIPNDLVLIDEKYASDNEFQCSRLAYNAFIQMYDAAEKEGYQLIINSAYRSYQDQLDIIEIYRQAYGDNYVNKYVARAGFSEHQTGLAFDIGSRNSRTFASSKEYSWMIDNAYKYGFILRYDERYEDLTGFRSEPWHYRYVGNKIAKYVYEHNNMSLEEYYVTFLDK